MKAIASFIFFSLTLALSQNEIIAAFQSGDPNTLDNLRTAINVLTNELVNQLGAFDQEANDAEANNLLQSNTVLAPLQTDVAQLQDLKENFIGKNAINSIPVFQREKAALQQRIATLLASIANPPQKMKTELTQKKASLEQKEKNLQVEKAKIDDIVKNLETFNKISENYATTLKTECSINYNSEWETLDKVKIEITNELGKIGKQVESLAFSFKEKEAETQKSQKERSENENKMEKCRDFLKGMQKYGDEFLPSLEKRLENAKKEVEEIFKTLDRENIQEEVNKKLENVRTRTKESEERLQFLEEKINEFAIPEEEETYIFIEKEEKEKVLSEEQLNRLHKTNREYLIDIIENNKISKNLQKIVGKMSRNELVFMSLFSTGSIIYAVYNLVIYLI